MNKKILLVSLLIIVLLTACSASNRILGKWEDADGSIYEFFKDGTMAINSFGISISGTYEFIESDTMKLNMDGLWGIGGATIAKVKFSGREMIWTIDGQSISFDKVK